MKHLVRNVLTAVLAALAMTLSSCKQVIEPQFPDEMLEQTVKAGGSVDVSFYANLDWEVYLEGDGVLTYFWIEENGAREKSTSNLSGRHTVTVHFSEDEEHDNDRVCNVFLMMANQSKQIARIQRLKTDRTLKLQLAEAFDAGFKKKDGNYVYADVTEGPLKFITFVDDPDYSLPIRVSTNFDWEISLPDWITSEVTSGNAGDTEVFLSAKLSSAIENGTKAEVKFIDRNNSEAIIPVAVEIDSFKDRVEFNANSLNFNAEGYAGGSSLNGDFSQKSAYITVLAAEGAAVKVLGKGEQWHDTAFADWAQVETVSSTGEGYLKTQVFALSVSPNTSDARVADVLVLPASKANVQPDALCDTNSDDCSFKAEYKPYVLGRLEQAGAEVAPEEGGILSLDPNFDNFKAFLTPAPDHWLVRQTGVKDIYYLTYTDQFSGAQILSSKPFAKAEVYDFNMNPAGEGFWAETWVPATKDKFKVNVDMSAYKRVGAADEELVPECFILLSDNSGTPIAIIDFKYDESAKEPSESGDMISISQGDGSVNKLTSGDIYYFINSEYSVTEVFQVAVSGAATIFKSTTAFDDVKIYSLTDDGTFKETTDGSLAVEGGANNTFYAYVGDGVPASSSWLVILKSNMVNTCALYITYTPSSAAALVSFVYPDHVRNATLAPYTGAMLSQILSEQYGATEDVVWELKYTGDPSTCMIYVPGEPDGKAAWNNYNDATGAPYDNYWLTYEYEDKTMYVMMSEAGKTDYFVWKDPATYKPSLILVCTAVASK